MAALDKSFIIDKLKLFLKQEEAEEALVKAATMAKVPVQNNYAHDEALRLVDGLLQQGGFVEFVARNLKIQVILNNS
mgnify:CR=1 FL=1